MPGKPSFAILHVAEEHPDHPVAAQLARLAPQVHRTSLAALRAGAAHLPRSELLLWQLPAAADNLDGLAFLRERFPDQPLVVLAPPEAEHLAAAALDDGASDYVLTTPAQLRRLPGLVARTVEALWHSTRTAAVEEELRLGHGAMAAVNDGIVLVDMRLPEQPLTYCNQAFTRITGYAAEEMFGRNCRILQGPGSDPAVVSRIRQAIEQARPCHVELLNYRRDGTPFWNEISLAPVFDADGELTHYVGTQRDITARRQTEARLQHELQARQAAEESLRAANERLERLNQSLEERIADRTARLREANAALAQANRLKDEFLTSMSHELRTPLSAILGRAELLGEELYGSLNERQLHAVQSIEASGRHLLDLINDILDLSKIEAGKLELELFPVHVAELCQSALSMVVTAAAQKRLTIEQSIDPAAQPIAGDERRLKQILVNLLGNAVKFTPEGGRVGLDVREDRAANELRITVWDTGIGIAREHQGRLFKPFVQIDSSLSRKYVGTGLGLALVARLTALHGGRVELESEPGQGSRFIVTLPYTARRS